MKEYEFMDDLTSDVLFKAYGADEEALFENAAKAMFSIICEPAQAETEINLELEDDNLEDLLYQWLSKLLAESEIQGLFFSEFSVELDGFKLKAGVKGSPASPERGRTQVKAVTMYKFGIEKVDDGFEATVSCDI